MSSTQTPAAEGGELAAIIYDAANLLSGLSIPLHADDAWGRPEQFATGFFVKAGGETFLVSAAHAFDRVEEGQDVYFYSSPNVARHFTGKIVRTSNKADREEDRLDVGVLHLSNGAGPPYPDVKKFAVDVSALKPGQRPRTGKNYIVIGFPATKSDVSAVARTVEVAPYAYRSNSLDEAGYGALGIDPNTHIALPLHLKDSRDAQGRHTHFPKPKGISGAPVIVLDDPDYRDSAAFPIVGVAIEHRSRDRVMVATDIGFVL